MIATKTDLSAKQDTLTAGTGIAIDRNTISATNGLTDEDRYRLDMSENRIYISSEMFDQTNIGIMGQ